MLTLNINRLQIITDNIIKILKTKFLCIMLLLPAISVGQDAIFSQFYANTLYLNPAFAGTQCKKLSMSYRNHPWPTFGTFSTYSVSYDADVPALSGGLGVIAYADREGGLLATYSISGIYSYHFDLSRNYSASLGVKAGYFRKELNWGGDFIFPDQYDPFGNGISPTGETLPEYDMRHNVDFAAGFLVFSDDLYAGISAYHLSMPDMGFYDVQRLPMKFTAHLGYNIYPRFGQPAFTQDMQGLTIAPNIIYQNQGNFHRLNAGAYFDYWFMTLGSWLRYDLKDNFYLIFLLGVNNDTYRIGYSYDYSLSGLYGITTGVHEISVSLKFDCSRKKTRHRILNCPTF